MEKILVVDDEEALRYMFAEKLRRVGYHVSTAIDGFDALLRMRSNVPDILVSDLNMPRMSGFELLSVVRRRFPKVCVIAISGAFLPNDAPTGIIADAFISKGSDADLALVVKNCLAQRDTPTFLNKHNTAPVWIPRNGHDSRGVPFIVLTCTECLRSFPLNVPEENPTHEVRTTPCVFCDTPVRYIIDFSLKITSPPPGGVRPY